MYDLFNQPPGLVERDKGIMKAETHADQVHDKWTEQAWQLFRKYLKDHPTGHTFLIEDFRKYASENNLPEPPSKRAFGGLALKAKSKGYIVGEGTRAVNNPKAHMANARVWRKI